MFIACAAHILVLERSLPFFTQSNASLQIGPLPSLQFTQFNLDIVYRGVEPFRRFVLLRMTNLFNSVYNQRKLHRKALSAESLSFLFRPLSLLKVQTMSSIIIIPFSLYRS